MKSSKKALFSSVVALVLCFSMFIGTTMAWFTDSVSSGVNQIIAGNLDIEVEYSTNGSAWTNLQGATSLFSNNRWEPGHTEVVYLKVTNAGSLALNYKVLVTPVSENGGVNVNGQSFKLSDYLVFGTTTPLNTLTTYTRDAARAAVGSTTGLNVNALTKSNTMDPQNVQYLALVVYMPETVGNEANYKTGTAAPTIELGIKVVATQKTTENDSFGNDYDNGAVTDSFYTVGAYYDYYPQVAASASVAASGNTVITAEGKLNKNDATAITLAKVTVPAEATLVPGTSKLTVNVVPKAPEASTTTGTALVTEINDSNRETANFDITVEGVDSSNNAADINVEVFVGKGLANVKVYHNGTLIEGTTYDASTGVVEFTTTSFSDYTVAYDVAVAAIGDKTYGTLALAIAAAQTDETVKLLKDVTLTSRLDVNKNITLDLDGKTISGGNSTNIYVTAGILSVKNGVIDVSGEAFRVDGREISTDGSLVLNLEPSVTVKSSNDCCVYIYGRATLNTSAKLYNNSEYTTIQTHGTHDTTVVNVMGGVLKNVGGPAIYFANGKELNISGGELTGTTAVSAKGGKVTISGNAVLHAVGEAFNPSEAENSGSNDTGDAFYIEDNYTPAVTATITGGTFISENAKAVNMLFKQEQKGSTIAISGGTFSSDPSIYVPEGHTIVEEENTYKVLRGVFVSTEAALKEALSNKVDVIFKNDFSIAATTGGYNKAGLVLGEGGMIDGCENTLTVSGANSTWDCGIYTKGGTIKNLTIRGPFRGVFGAGVGQDVVIENCDIDAVYPFNHDGRSNYSVIVKNSVLHGWTSYGEIKAAHFIESEFSLAKSGYDCVAAYTDTFFTDCTFDEHFVVYAQTAGFTFNFENCVKNGVAVTAENFKTLFSEDSDVWSKCTCIVNGVTVTP